MQVNMHCTVQQNLGPGPGRVLEHPTCLTMIVTSCDLTKYYKYRIDLAHTLVKDLETPL